MADPKTSWEEYRLLIVSELERLNAGIAALNQKMDLLRNEDINKMKMDISNLKLKLTMLAIAAGGTGAGAVEMIKAFMVR